MNEDIEQKKKEWAKMSIEEKAIWNGFEGYVKGKLKNRTSLFIPEKLRKENL